MARNARVPLPRRMARPPRRPPIDRSALLTAANTSHHRQRCAWLPVIQLHGRAPGRNYLIRVNSRGDAHGTAALALPTAASDAGAGRSGRTQDGSGAAVRSANCDTHAAVRYVCGVKGSQPLTCHVPRLQNETHEVLSAQLETGLIASFDVRKLQNAGRYGVRGAPRRHTGREATVYDILYTAHTGSFHDDFYLLPSVCAATAIL